MRGDLHSYKIHLGSGNILIEPYNQYLWHRAIAQRDQRRWRHQAVSAIRGRPDAGDQSSGTALLLANDTKIADRSIVAAATKQALELYLAD